MTAALHIIFFLAIEVELEGAMLGTGVLIVFLGISHVHRGYTCYYTCLFFFLLILIMSGLSQEPRKGEGRRLGFIPTTSQV